ncbi:response regulator [Caproiciproducens galactitolivorans]|uniref:Stage 0 sporulation protein A homolog n=1 Tax=Caproiciproducens galactitolivorans TaxID=642589 RepID=A0ABT4BQ13_9FIRM|nr:response regulator [Caproiciproducens galactitolivorans]MCY1712968.1 response regulator [Caproiciproducens galactitolivorans]
MKKVLIADDNEQNREIAKDVLSTWGYTCYTAVNGPEVLSSACQYDPDVILLDVMMPGMNGFEVCRKLKNNIATQNIPIIMLTVLTKVQDRIRGYSAGTDIFLSKPIIYEELKNRVEWAVNSKRTYSKMERESQVVKSYLNLMELKDRKLFDHACNVKNYCEKVGKILFVKDEEMIRLQIGAYLHDIGKILCGDQEEHVTLGTEILSSLNMHQWLSGFIRNHHEKMNGEGFPDHLTGNQMSLELRILITVNRFIELYEQTGSKETGIVRLSEECEKGDWDAEILEKIKQVQKDEEFIERMNFNQ